MRKRLFISNVISLMLGALIFGTAAFASSASITVNFLPLKYFVNAEQKTPPADQQGFVYKGKTYVPLRFLTESLGYSVAWNAKDSSIHINSSTGTGGTVTPPDLTPLGENKQKDGEFSGLWISSKGNKFNLKQEGSNISGTAIYYWDRLKTPLPIEGTVNGDTLEFNVIWNNPDSITGCWTDMPYSVAQQILGIKSKYVYKKSSNVKLEGYLYELYVDWEDNTVIKKYDGGSESAKELNDPVESTLTKN